MFDEKPYQWALDNPAGYANTMGRYKTEREWAFLSRYLGRSRLRVLDIGGGSGRFALPMAELGHELVVVDLSEEALRQLRLAVPPGVSVSLRHGDFLATDFTECFDVVVAIESIQYFTTVRLTEVFRKIASLLRPGGYLVFTELNQNSWRQRMRGARSGPKQYNTTSSRGYRAGLTDAGLVTQDMEGFVWMPFTVSSNSQFVPVFASIERLFQLRRWVRQSPWLLIAARKPH